MQRLLSLATLAVMGGLGYLFLKGGGLDQVIVAPRANQSQTAGQAAQNGSPSVTPVSQAPFTISANGENGIPTIRVASFNIQVFGDKKAKNPNVMNVLAKTIQMFDVVAIQEIRSKNQYLIPEFVELINREGRKFDHILGPRLGDSNIKEQYAYLFDTERIDLDPHSVYTIGDPDRMLHRPPYVASFRTRGVDANYAFTFTLVNIHTDPDEVLDELAAMAEVYRVVRRAGRGEDDIIILGDLNTDDRNLYRLGQLPGILPLISGMYTNTRQNKLYDNIVIHRPSTTEYMGRASVLNLEQHFKLTREQALLVSDHFPVWAEFSIYERDAAGRVASHGQRENR